MLPGGSIFLGPMQQVLGGAHTGQAFRAVSMQMQRHQTFRGLCQQQRAGLATQQIAQGIVKLLDLSARHDYLTTTAPVMKL